MVVLAVDQIFWTRETEAAMAKDGAAGVRAYRDECTAQLNEVVALVRTKLTKLQRIGLGAMVTMDVHGRDVLSTMVTKGVSKVGDFDWISQLRYASTA